jgi:hypothetical protein
MKSRRVRQAGHVERMGGEERCIQEKPEGKNHMEYPRVDGSDNIKMDLREVWWRGVDWVDLAKSRNRWRAFVNAVMNRLVPQNAGNFLNS